MATTRRIPKNKVWAGGTPPEQSAGDETVDATNTNVRSFRVAKIDAGGALQACGATDANPLCVVGRRQYPTPKLVTGADMAEDDIAEVYYLGSGAWVVIETDEDLSGNEGELVQTAAAGTIGAMPATAAAGDEKEIVGRLLIGADGSSTTAKCLVVI